ncbi:MAG TPA: SDR family oxidoreductase [Solirubrobacteraceae bacterium]|jgi:nucleoside-diphosphate-sugar epimerase|nr:SDR family oxidoreductase [Solirubrobacteraceae bacterium]
MDVVIAGGHGKVARRLSRLLHLRGDRVRALIRKPAQDGDVVAAGAEPVVCDLEQVDDDVLVATIASADAVVFAAGAGPGSGPERKWAVDYGGAVKLMRAAQADRIERYVMLSSRGADPEAPGDDTFAVYLRAKGKADAELGESGLAYTIVRPGRLTDDPGTDRVRAGADVGDGSISRDDVAAVLAFAVHDPALATVTFEVVAGETPIAEALAACRSAGGHRPPGLAPAEAS